MLRVRSSAWARRKAPAGVNVVPCGDRTNRRVPIQSSRDWMRRLKAGCVTCRAPAAREKVLCSASARKSSSQFRSMGDADCACRSSILALGGRCRAVYTTYPTWLNPATGDHVMKIIEIREVTAPIASSIANAYIDFSKMTLSLVAVVTDVVRDGHRVVGYGFNSNGRYGQGGLIRERFAPRILEAQPESLLDDTGENLDPDRIWATMMKNEKPGGHGERSVAVGTIDMAVWDAVAKIAGEPLFRLLAKRHGREADPRVFVYAAGGYYYPGKGDEALRAEMRGYLDRGYNVVKMKIGGASIGADRERIEAGLG